MSWPITRLSEVVKFVGGGTPSKATASFWTGDIPWISPKDMASREITDSTDHITRDAIENSATQLVPPGTVLCVVRSGVLAHTFPVAIAMRDVALNQDLKALIPSPQILGGEFLAYFLQSKSKEILSGYVKMGATVHSIDIDKFRQMEMPLPPLSEQRQIVAILDQADALRKMGAEADRKSEQILPALYIKMFGDPNRNPMRWPVRNLADLAEELRYGTSARCVETPEGLPVLRIPNVVRGEIDLSDLKYCELTNDEVELLRLAPGDLLIVRTNGNREYVGRCAVFTEDRPCLFASYLIRVRLDRDTVDPWYVSAFLGTTAGRYAMSPVIRTTAGQSNINTQGLRQLNLPVPPLERQEVFRDRVLDVRGLLKRQREARERVEVVFSSLLTKAFSGELTAKWRQDNSGKLLAEIGSQQSELGNQPAVRKRA